VSVYLNLFVWRVVSGRQRQPLMASRLMGVSGQLQLEGEVMHVIAHRLANLSRWLGKVATRPRDFH